MMTSETKPVYPGFAAGRAVSSAQASTYEYHLELMRKMSSEISKTGVVRRSLIKEAVKEQAARYLDSLVFDLQAQGVFVVDG